MVADKITSDDEQEQHRPSSKENTEKAGGDFPNVTRVQVPIIRYKDMPAVEPRTQDYVTHERQPRIPVWSNAPMQNCIVDSPRSRFPAEVQQHSLVGQQHPLFSEQAYPYRRGILLTPETFDGSMPWQNYMAHFGSCATVNGWNESQKANYLAASLRGRALQIYGEQHGPMTYPDITRLLGRHFGGNDKVELYMIEIRNRQQKEGESIQDLGQAIQRLTNLAYPDATQDCKDRLARSHFTEAIRDRQVRLSVVQSRPRTLEEAIQAAFEMETYLECERLRPADKARSRQLRILAAKPERQNDQVEQLSRLMETINKFEKKLESLPVSEDRVAQSGSRKGREQTSYKQKTQRERRDQGTSRHPLNQHSNPASSLDQGEVIPLKKSGNGLYIAVNIEGKSVELLLDTGSTENVMSHEQYLTLTEGQRCPKLLPTSDEVKQANGSSLKLYGRIRVTIQVKTVRKQVDFLVADIRGSAILGLDFLGRCQAKLDLERQELRLGMERGPSSQSSEKLCWRLSTQQEVTIPSCGEAFIPCAVKPRAGHATAGEGLIEPDLQLGLLNKGLMIARAIVDIKKQIVPIRVFNPHPDPVVMKGGFTTGIIRILDKSQAQTLNSEHSFESDARVPESLRDLWRRSCTELTESQSKDVAVLLKQYRDVFAADSKELGKTNIVRHSINTGDASPVRQHYRRLPIVQQEAADSMIQDMLERQVIEPSSSPWASPIVLARKGSDEWRFCCDYRRLNDRTIKDAHPIPRIDDTLDALHGSQFYATMDIASGFWQVELDEEAKRKSAFCTRSGLFQWRVMPFGLCNAPSTFSRLMEQVLKGLHWEMLLVYLDDVIVFGKDFKQVLSRLRTVFDRFREAGLKLKPSKCHFFKRQVSYLGHTVSAEGVSTDPQKVDSVRDWPIPKNVSEVRSFLGLASYYRRFIKDFANIARPLHSLTEKNSNFMWNTVCDEAFILLKEELISAPILAYPSHTELFILDTDASNFAMGAVLSQVQDGSEKVIAYASKTLSKQERNYCVTRRGLLAVVTFIKYFRHYLYGREFLIRTDHVSLRWLLNFKDPEGQLARWLGVLSEYDFRIEHRPGKKHGNADGMSRKPCKQCGMEDTATGMLAQLIIEPQWSLSEIHTEQMSDPDLKPIFILVESHAAKPKWEELSSESATTKVYWGLWDSLEIVQGVLCRKWADSFGNQKSLLTVVPRSLQKQILYEAHSGKAGGHFAYMKTLSKVRKRFYWHGMSDQLRSLCSTCKTCAARRKPTRKSKAPLQQYSVGAPLERLAMDILGPFPVTESGNRVICVVGDYYTKWVEAYALPNQEAKTVARALVEQFICRFGVPQEIHTDQGRNFESELFSEICRIFDIHKTRTTPFNPKSDGMVERFNKTVVDILAKYLDPLCQQKDWDQKLPFALMAYRSAAQESTKQTPNKMMFGRELSMPVDVMIQNPSVDKVQVEDYPMRVKEYLSDVWDKARIILKDAGHRQKKNYDRNLHSKSFKMPRPYTCHQCRQIFSSSSNLSRHVREKHRKRERYSCPDCNRDYGRKEDMLNHRRLRHRHRSSSPVKAPIVIPPGYIYQLVPTSQVQAAAEVQAQVPAQAPAKTQAQVSAQVPVAVHTASQSPPLVPSPDTAVGAAALPETQHDSDWEDVEDILLEGIADAEKMEKGTYMPTAMCSSSSSSDEEAQPPQPRGKAIRLQEVEDISDEEVSHGPIKTIVITKTFHRDGRLLSIHREETYY
ncbi:uncharacterized protein [Haliotis asinina]|uniref:uncharacterized protein n=1 Tax=Haliotis asinina TaxID=109174 RepID=UPI0035325905